MTELILSYIGAVLISLEFVRGAKIITGFKALQAFIGMLFALPFRPYLNSMASNRKPDIKAALICPLLFYALIFTIVMIPLSIFFYLFYVIITPLELIHFVVNDTYHRLQKGYRPTYGFWTRYRLRSSVKFKGIKEQQVIDELQKKDIPILPIIGIVLITIAFISEITNTG